MKIQITLIAAAFAMMSVAATAWADGPNGHADSRALDRSHGHHGFNRSDGHRRHRNNHSHHRHHDRMMEGQTSDPAPTQETAVVVDPLPPAPTDPVASTTVGTTNAIVDTTLPPDPTVDNGGMI